MNGNKKNNNGWILCPSKTFSGKFYYFNTNNGATLWSSDEMDKRMFQKVNNVPRIFDKCHCYPEPSSPPDDDNYAQYPRSTKANHSTSEWTKDPSFMSQSYKRNFNYQNSTNSYQNAPMFMPPMFPYYKSYEEPYIPDVMWIPIHLPRSFLFQNGPRLYRPMLDQITQTHDDVENSNKSFENPTKLKTAINSSQSSDFSQEEHSYCSNKIIGKGKLKRRNAISNATDPETILKRNKTLSHVEAPYTSKSEDVADGIVNHTLKPGHKVDFSATTCLNDNTNTTYKNTDINFNLEESLLNGIAKTDLRYSILAKRKSKFNEETLQGKYAKQNKEYAPPKKKKVTFLLEDENNAESDDSMKKKEEDINDFTHIQKKRITIADLRNLANTILKKSKHWYIAVDLNILLEEFDFIDNYVQRDPKCILLLPHAVRSQLDAICTGDSCGRLRVAIARQLSRKLASVVQHRVVQAEVEGEIQMSVNDSILNCCLDVMSREFHVVLITNDDDLYTEARSIDIHCFKLEDIKDCVVPRPRPPFDLKKIQLTVTNKKESIDKLPFEISNRESDVNTKHECINNFKKHSFTNDEGIQDNKTKNRPLCFENTVYDTIDTKTNICDKLIDITGLKFPPLNKKKCTKYSSEKSKNCTELNEIDSDEIDFSKHTTTNEPIVSMKQSNSIFQHDNIDTNLLVDKGNKLDTRNDSTNSFEILNPNCSYVSENNFMRTDAMENKVHRFFIKNTAMNVRLKVRMDEWICHFSQIMESVLFGILQRYKITKIDDDVPWNVYGAIEAIGEIYQDRSEIVILVDKLTDLLTTNSHSSSGKLRCDMKPDVFIKLFGYGILLIEGLQKTLPDSEELKEALENLNDVLYVMEDPRLDQNPDLESLKNNILNHNHDVIENDKKRNFIKTPSYIMEYLMKHCPESKAYSGNQITNIVEKTTEHDHPQIFRVFGKDLNSLKINKLKTITIDNIDTVKDDRRQTSAEKENDIFNRPIHGNTFDDLKKMDGPKVIRKLNIIDAFENKITNSMVSDDKKTTKNIESSRINILSDINVIGVEKMDNNKIEDTLNNGPELIRNTDIKAYEYELNSNPINYDNWSLQTLVLKNNDEIDNTNDTTKYNDTIGTTHNDLTQNDTYVQYDDKFSQNSNSEQYNDYYDKKNVATRNNLESDGSHLYYFVKTFLIELSSTLILIHQFLKYSTKVLLSENVKDENKKNIQGKAINTLTYLSRIIHVLERIVQREPTNIVIKQLLIETGEPACSDKRVIKYRHVISKCVEQARILESALKCIVRATDDNCDSHLSNDSIPIGYINIFE